MVLENSQLELLPKCIERNAFNFGPPILASTVADIQNPSTLRLTVPKHAGVLSAFRPDAMTFVFVRLPVLCVSLVLVVKVFFLLLVFCIPGF